MLGACPRWLAVVEGVGHCMTEEPNHAGRRMSEEPWVCPVPSAAGPERVDADVVGRTCRASAATRWTSCRRRRGTRLGRVPDRGRLSTLTPHSSRYRYKDHVVYIPPSYGPSVYKQPYFEDAAFPHNMPPIWERQ